MNRVINYLKSCVRFWLFMICFQLFIFSLVAIFYGLFFAAFLCIYEFRK